MDVHYTWMGAPPADRQRDITEPKRTSARVQGKDHLYFWCLDEHVTAYEHDFAGCKNVTVRGMQAFLARAASTAYRWYYWYKKSDDWAVQAMADILAWGLERGTPASYRAFVKDAWSLFLMYTWGGYVLDAGVGPLDAGSLSLPEPKSFMAPTLTKDDALAMRRFRPASLPGPFGQFDMTLNDSWADDVCTAMNYTGGADGDVETCPQIEVWMLASPRYGNGAWAALRQYCLAWARMQLHGTLTAQNAPQVFRYLIAGSVYNGLTDGHAGEAWRASLWDCRNDVSGRVEVPALKLRKTYHGSSAK
jgi:hypothetical protein